MSDNYSRQDRDDIYSEKVFAGKRIYFFDIKPTRNNDYYVTITERTKKFDDGGQQSMVKHKIFVYKEDFDKFQEALAGAINHVKTELLPDVDFSQFSRRREQEEG